MMHSKKIIGDESYDVCDFNSDGPEFAIDIHQMFK